MLNYFKTNKQMKRRNKLLVSIGVCALLFCSFKINKTISAGTVKQEINPWPKIKQEMHPWTRWWWMSSAVDERNLDKVLTAYSNAGFGGVELTPVYGAIGFEK